MRNLSDETRRLICKNLEEGRNDIQGLAITFNVSYSTVDRIWTRFSETGEYKSKRKGGNRKKKLNQLHIDYIKELIDENCLLSLRSIQESLSVICEVDVCLATIHRVIGAFNYTFKRVIFRPISGETEELWTSRQAFSTWLLRQHNDNKTFFFLDETGFKLEMRSQYGRSIRGGNAENIVPNIRSRNINIIAAMSSSKIVHYEILNGNGNAESFAHFIDNLAHARDTGGYSNDTILVMDNVAFHRSPLVREIIELRGFQYYYLPPYSPYLNPIESLFSQWKNLIKTTFPKNEGELMRAINSIGDIVTENHCKNYCQHVRSNCLKILEGARNNFN